MSKYFLNPKTMDNKYVSIPMVSSATVNQDH